MGGLLGCFILSRYMLFFLRYWQHNCTTQEFGVATQPPLNRWSLSLVLKLAVENSGVGLGKR